MRARARHVLLDPFHLRRESIAKPGHRHDELLAVLAERLSDDRDVASETRVFNEAVWPHRLEQLLLRDDFTRALDERQQRSERFRGERDRLAIA